MDVQQDLVVMSVTPEVIDIPKTPERPKTPEQSNMTPEFLTPKLHTPKIPVVTKSPVKTTPRKSKVEIDRSPQAQDPDNVPESYNKIPIEGRRWKLHPSKQRYPGGVNTAVNDISVNCSPTYEQFTLGVGEKKVEEQIDTRTPNTVIFTFNKEDHTMGNLLRDKLLKNSHVTFAAYKVPHPLFAKFELRVQTDGQITPKEALKASCEDLVRELNQLDQEFTKAYELTKMVGGGGQNGA